MKSLRDGRTVGDACPYGTGLKRRTVGDACPYGMGLKRRTVGDACPYGTGLKRRTVGDACPYYLIYLSLQAKIRSATITFFTPKLGKIS